MTLSPMGNRVLPKKLPMDKSFANYKRRTRPKGLEEWRVFDSIGRFSERTRKRMELKCVGIFHPHLRTAQHARMVGMSTLDALQWLEAVPKCCQPRPVEEALEG